MNLYNVYIIQGSRAFAGLDDPYGICQAGERHRRIACPESVLYSQNAIILRRALLKE